MLKISNRQPVQHSRPLNELELHVRDIMLQLYDMVKDCKRLEITHEVMDTYLLQLHLLFTEIKFNGRYPLFVKDPTPFLVDKQADGVIILSCAVNCDTTKLKLRKVHDLWQEKIGLAHHPAVYVNLHLQTEDPYPHDLYTALLHVGLSKETLALAAAQGIRIQ